MTSVILPLQRASRTWPGGLAGCSAPVVTTSPSVLLVNYAGYVLTANTFVPDNSLATLAGALRAEDIPVRIVDWMNPGDIGSIGDRAGTGDASRVVERLSTGQAVDATVYLPYRNRRLAAQRDFERDATERLLRLVERERATVVGFKLWSGSGFAANLRMAAAVRETFPHVVLAAGGPMVTYCEEYLLHRTRIFDHLVSGDGEAAILAIARGAARGGLLRLDRRVRRDGSRAYNSELDQLPFPDYSRDAYPDLDRFFATRVIDDSRGCFNRCAFCAHPRLSGVTRTKQADRVVDEMELAFRHDGVRFFRLSGSNPPWKHLNRIADCITERRLPFRYSAYASLNNVRVGDMSRLAASGLSGLFFGVESGDPDLLRRAHNKNNGSHKHVVETIRSAMQNGIFACVSVIIPAPFETPRSEERTFDLLCEAFSGHRHGSVLVMPSFLTPASTWWESRSHYGFELDTAINEASYVTRLLDWDQDFLLPRNLAPHPGFSLGGRGADELFARCTAFIARLEREGISTNVDDAAFMIALMGGMPVARFKAEMVKNLILGGSARLTSFVASVNASGGGRAGAFNGCAA